MNTFEMNNATERALKMDVYAIYLRKSRADRDAEKYGITDTLERHRNTLTALAAQQGLYIGEIYEEVVSGETIAARPEIQRLIADCYAGKYKGVLVMAIDRLSRGNQGDAQKIMDVLKYANNNDGVKVITPSRRYDIAHNSDDEDFMEMELFFARKEYKSIKKRMDIGKKQTIVEGNYLSTYRPYGYQIIKKGKLRTLIADENEAPYLKKIFEWKAVDKMTAGAIARKLTQLGVPTYTNALEWSDATVKSILQNPVYYGKVRWNDRMQVKTMKDGELVVSRPRSNHTAHYMEYDGRHKGLVTEEMYIEANKSFGSDKTKADFTLRNPLAGLIICPKCGYAMTYNGSMCKNARPRLLHKQMQKCKVKSVVLDDVMAALIHGLKQYLEDFKIKIDNTPEVDEQEIILQIQTLEKERRKVEKILDNIFNDYESGVYTANEFVQRKAKHNERLEQIEAQIFELNNAMPERHAYEEMFVSLYEAIELLRDNEVDAKIKNEYLKTFIDRIEFSRESADTFALDIYLK